MNTREILLYQEIPVIVINVILGVGTIHLPATLAQSAGTDGIIAFIVASCLAIIGAVLIACLVLRFPNQGIGEYTTELIGIIPGFIFNILFSLYLLFASAAVLRTFSNTVNIFLLPRTPLAVIMISMLVATTFLARNGLQPIARSCQIILYLFVLPFVLLPFFISIFDFGEFLPLFQTNFKALARASLGAAFSLAGVEVLLVIGSHVQIKKRFMKMTLLSIVVAALIAFLLICLTFGTLSVEQTAKLQDPLFEMIKYLPVPVLFIERADLFFFTVWITASYSTILILLYSVSHHLAETFKQKSGKSFVIPAAVSIYFLAKVPTNDIDVEQFTNLITVSWLILVFGIVPLFLLLSYIRKKGKKDKTNP